MGKGGRREGVRRIVREVGCAIRKQACEGIAHAAFFAYFTEEAQMPILVKQTATIYTI